jgi:hypothetical protein
MFPNRAAPSLRGGCDERRAAIDVSKVDKRFNDRYGTAGDDYPPLRWRTTITPDRSSGVAPNLSRRSAVSCRRIRGI